MSNIKKIFYQVDTKKIDKRIVLLTDIHYYSKKERRYLDKVLAELTKIEYDYLCISGDLIDRSRIEDEELLVEWIKEGWEDPREKGKATHCSILAWRMPWTVQSMGSQIVGHD